MKKSAFTVDPVEPGDRSGCLPEFARSAQIYQIYGLRRGTLYNLWHAGLISGVSLRRKGQKFSCRLWFVPSISAYLHSLLKAQAPGVSNSTVEPQFRPEYGCERIDSAAPERAGKNDKQ